MANKALSIQDHEFSAKIKILEHNQSLSASTNSKSKSNLRDIRASQNYSRGTIQILNSSETSKYDCQNSTFDQLQQQQQQYKKQKSAKDRRPKIVVKAVDNQMLQARQSQDRESMHKRMKQFREKLNLKFETSFSLEPWLPSAANKR